MSDAGRIVRDAIAREFHISLDQITDATTAEDVPGWDSFSNGSLILHIEGELSVELPLEEALSAANVGELIQVVARAVQRRA